VKEGRLPPLPYGPDDRPAGGLLTRLPYRTTMIVPGIVGKIVTSISLLAAS